MAAAELSIRSNGRNAVLQLRKVLSPYRSGDDRIPTSDFKRKGVWRWVIPGREDARTVRPLWSNATDIHATMTLGSWLYRFRDLLPEAIYVISAGDVSKIGVSSDIRSRLQSLQNGNPVPLEIRAMVWVNSHPRRVEAGALASFEAEGRRLAGEWVDADWRSALTTILRVAHAGGALTTPPLGMLTSFTSSILPSYLAAERGFPDRPPTDDSVGDFVTAMFAQHSKARTSLTVR